MKTLFYAGIFLLLWIGFLLLFLRNRWLRTLERLVRISREKLDAAAARRLLENKQSLLELHRKYTLAYRLEQELNYSGLRRIFKQITVERWAVWNGLAGLLILFAGMAFWGIQKTGLLLGALFASEYLVIFLLKRRNFLSVNENLIKFLDFLGNYSLTSGELTGIFAGIGKYMDEPLKSVLEECGTEAQTTGDTGQALLAMAEKIEHPKFKELVRNMEISYRYSADLTLLVNSSRRILREYLRLREEKRGMLREAFINMSLLLILSAVTLCIVDTMTDVSVFYIVRHTLPGKIALGAVGLIVLLFLKKVLERR